MKYDAPASLSRFSAAYQEQDCQDQNPNNLRGGVNTFRACSLGSYN